MPPGNMPAESRPGEHPPDDLALDTECENQEVKRFSKLTIAVLTAILVIGGPCMSANTNSPYINQRGPLEDSVAPRELIWLNGEWDFAPQSEYAAPKPEEWSSVKIRIPSSWNINAFSGGKGPGGDFVTFLSYPKEWETTPYGWHKREFTLKTEQLTEKRIILHFEAVMYEAEVYVNGRLAGRHTDGFTPFEFDITDLVKPGSNEVMVGARDASHLAENGRSTWPTGSFWGEQVKGIWQDVYIRILPETYVSDLYVVTSLREKKITVEASIRNDSRENMTLELALAIKPVKDSNKTVPTIKPERFSVNPGETKVVTITAPWPNPELWEPESPFLYHLVASLSNDNRLDQTIVRFGFREFWIEGTRLILNGLPIRMRGDAWHFMGVPQLTDEYPRAWYEACKAANVNQVRVHAQIYPRYYMDVADEVGMLIVNENAIWASHCNYTYNDNYWNRAAKHTEDWVRRDRNHPSVIIWSVDNEFSGAHFVNPNDGAPSLDWLFQQVTDHLVSVIKKYDSTRPISADGDMDHEGRLPITNLHYCGIDPPEQKYRTKPVTIGEIGPMYYSIPEDQAKYVGDVVFESSGNRWKGCGIEMLWQTQHHRKWTEYTSPFNMVWYSLEPLPFSGETWTYSKYDSPGMKPDRLGPFTSTLNAGFDPKLPKWKPNAYYPYMKDSFIPQRFFFDDRAVRFYAGDRVKRTITIHNDIHRPAEFKLDINVTGPGGRVHDESRLIKMQSAGVETTSFEFVAPSVETRRDLDVSVRISEDGKTIFEQTQKCSVFPKQVKTLRGVAVLAADEKLQQVLMSAGIEFFAVENLINAPLNQPLLLWSTPKLSDEDRDKLMGRVKDGLRVIFFGQVPWIQPGWGEKGASEAYAFPADPGHPIFRNLKPTDLQLWGGDATVVATYVAFLPANARALLYCNNGWTAAYEQRLGKGRILGCGLDIAKEKTEPAARLMFANLIDYAVKAPNAALTDKKTVFIGDINSEFGKMLDILGVEYAQDSAALSDAGLALLDAGKPFDQAAINALPKFVKDGGKLLVWKLVPETLDAFNKAFGLSVRLTEAAPDIMVKPDAGICPPKDAANVNGLVFVEGVLETEPGGAMRVRQDSLCPSPADVDVPSEIAKKLHLKPGDALTGWARPPAFNERRFRLVRADSVNYQCRVDPLLVGVNNAELNWLGKAQMTMVDHSAEVPDGQVLVRTPRVNWHAWIGQGENVKTAATLKSELFPAPDINGLIRVPMGKGEIIISQIVARPTRSKSRKLIGTLLENLGAPMPRQRNVEFTSGIDEDGYIRIWLVTEPYSEIDRNGNDMTYDWVGGESDLLPEEGKRWKQHTSVVDSTLDLQSLYPGKENCAAYAAVYVWSPKSGEVLLDHPDMLKADLRVGSDDGIKVWLNGTEIWSNPALRPVTPDNDIIKDVKLRKGWNLLLMKVGQTTGGWAAIARFTDPDGNPVQGLKYSTTLPEELRK